MSLLGFDAIGRSALGTLATSTATNTIFRCDAGPYALVGPPAVFVNRAASSPAAYGSSGSIRFATSVSGVQGSYSSSGRAASFQPGMSMATGTFGLVGQSALASAPFVSLGAGYSVVSPAVQAVVSISAGLGFYTVVAFDASFGRGLESWFPLPQDSDAWTARSGAGADWEPPSAPADAWTREAEPEISWTLLSNRPSGWTAR